MHELARKRAAAPLAGPFAGVPFLAKDLCQEYAGVPTSYGTRALKDEQFAPTEHAEMMERWLRAGVVVFRSEAHTSELQSLMRISYAVFCLKKKNTTQHHQPT